jgi:hypothetical protein
MPALGVKVPGDQVVLRLRARIVSGRQLLDPGRPHSKDLYGKAGEIGSRARDASEIVRSGQ